MASDENLRPEKFPSHTNNSRDRNEQHYVYCVFDREVVEDTKGPGIISNSNDTIYLRPLAQDGEQVPIASDIQLKLPETEVLPNVQPEKPPEKSNLKKIIVLVFLSALVLSLSNIIIKKLNHIPPLAICCYRLCGIWVINLLVLIYKRSPICPEGYRWKLFQLSVLGCLSLSLKYIAISYIDVVDVVVISYSAPAIVVMFKGIFKRKDGMVYFSLIFILAFIGVIAITCRPFVFNYQLSEHTGNEIGMATAVLSVVFLSIGHLLSQDLQCLDVNTMFMTTIGVPIVIQACVITAIDDWVPLNSTYDIVIIIFLGVSGYFLHLFINTVGVMHRIRENTSMRTLEVIITFVLQLVLISPQVHWLSIVGGILITLSAILIGLGRVVQNLPTDSKIKIFLKL